MLVLTRKTQESILIGDDIKIVVIDSTRTRVRLGISAPGEFVIRRLELAERLGEIAPPYSTDPPACPEPVLVD